MKGRARTKGAKKTPPDVAAKTAEMAKEGYRGDVAAAAAWSMARRGDLGSRGGYERKTDRPRGPRGRQRRGA